MNQAAYFMSLKNIRDNISEDKRGNFDLQLAIKEKSTTLALVLSIFFGTLGIDRFYLGDIFLGLLKLFTLGFFGIWTLIDWFLIMGTTRDKNILIAKNIQYLDSPQPDQRTSYTTPKTDAKAIFMCSIVAIVFLILIVSVSSKNHDTSSTQTSYSKNT